MGREPFVFWRLGLGYPRAEHCYSHIINYDQGGTHYEHNPSGFRLASEGLCRCIRFSSLGQSAYAAVRCFRASVPCHDESTPGVTAHPPGSTRHLHGAASLSFPQRGLPPERRLRRGSWVGTDPGRAGHSGGGLVGSRLPYRPDLRRLPHVQAFQEFLAWLRPVDLSARSGDRSCTFWAKTDGGGAGLLAAGRVDGSGPSGAH